MTDYIDPLMSRSCATNFLCHKCGVRYDLDGGSYACCGQTLDIQYNYDLAAYRIKQKVTRSSNVFYWEELLPIRSFEARAKVGFTSGNTPIIKAEALGAELGLKNLWIKDDSTQRPSLSYKDRVVSMGIARAMELGLTRVGCVSTGNVGIATAAHAAKAGIEAVVLYPGGIEEGKLDACRALGATVIQYADATFDEVNQLAKEMCAAGELDIINVSLRPFYAEGAKTLAFETITKLGRAPDSMVIPVAGGTLSSRVWKGLREYGIVTGLGYPTTKVHLAQAASSDPVTQCIKEFEKAQTVSLCSKPKIVTQTPDSKAAPSLNIGNPGDGILAADAAIESGGYAASASEQEIYDGITLLAKTEGILGEGAAGTTVACLTELVNKGKIDPDEQVVAVISGSGYKVLPDIPKVKDVRRVSIKDARHLNGAING